MPCRPEPHDDESWIPYDQDEDDDFPEGEDEDDDGTDPCPHCGAAIWGDSVQCPTCGAYLSREDAPTPRPPLWITLGALAALTGMAWLILR